MIRIAREAEVVGVVTHVKALGPRVWGFSQALVRRVERARDEGVSIYADQYPYAASGTSIVGALIPRWALAGGHQALLARLDDPEQRARIRDDVLENLERRGGAGRLLIQNHEGRPPVVGQTLAQAAESQGVEPADLALRMLRQDDAGLVSFNMDERDVTAFMRQPWTMTSSDGGLAAPDSGPVHPRFYGTFPRKVRRYVLELAVLTLADAVRSMTSLPASVFGLTERGLLRSGAVADVVVFDLETLRDRATFQDPHRDSEGIRYVLVAGRLAVDGGKTTGQLGGSVLRRQE